MAHTLQYKALFDKGGDFGNCVCPIFWDFLGGWIPGKRQLLAETKALEMLFHNLLHTGCIGGVFHCKLNG